MKKFTLKKSGPSSSSSGFSSSRKPPPATLAPSLAEQDGRMSEYSSPDDVCPVCRTDRYLQPKLRLMVSFCYHKMCESCVDRIFSLGPSPCPICQTTIRKAQFKPQLFESLGVQKEVAVRRRTAKIFNKREEDFADLESYNRYLEECEEITFKLIHSLDVVATEAQIKKYELENRAQIEENWTREETDKVALQKQEEEERKLREKTREAYELLDEAEREARERERKAVLEGLESSTASASQILTTARTSALSSLPSLSSLFSNLTKSSLQLPPLPIATHLEPLDSLNWYDSYDSLFDTPHGGGGAKTSGGWIEAECWEKAVRASVAGLWIEVLEDEDAVVKMEV